MPASLLAVESLISPRVHDQSRSPHFRPFPSAPVDDASDVDTDAATTRDQTRRKARFSTSSLPDIDW